MKAFLQVIGVAFVLLCPITLLLFATTIFHDFLAVAFAVVGILAIVAGVLLPEQQKRRRVIVRRGNDGTRVPRHQRDAIADALEQLS